MAESEISKQLSDIRLVKNWAEGAEEEDDEGAAAAGLTEEQKAEAQAQKAILQEANQKKDVIVEKYDDSDIFTTKQFEDPALGLNPALLKAIREDFCFKNPTKIQEAALPIVLGPPGKGKDKNAVPPVGRSLIAQANSGSGKTITFCTAMLHRVDINLKAPQAIVVSHTRELAQQTFNVLKKLAIHMGVSVKLIVPGKYDSNTKITDQVLTCTPDSLALSAMNAQNPLFDAKLIKVLVLDEADLLLGPKFKQTITKIHSNLPNTTQFLFFSATFEEETVDVAEQIINKHGQRADKIVLKKEQRVLKNIKQYRIDFVNPSERYPMVKGLCQQLEQDQQVIVFVRDKHTCSELCQRMTADKIVVEEIHSGLKPLERDAVIKKFRSLGLQVIIATSGVIGRGFDVDNVSMVVMYDIPQIWERNHENRKPADVDTYIHMMGRTGRVGRLGVCLSFVCRNATDRSGRTFPSDDQALINEIEKELATSTDEPMMIKLENSVERVSELVKKDMQYLATSNAVIMSNHVDQQKQNK